MKTKIKNSLKKCKGKIQSYFSDIKQNKKKLIGVASVFACAIFVSTLLIINARAANACVSNGTGGGNWSAAATWSSCGGGVPAAGDSVAILNGDTVSITASVAANPASLTIGGASAGTLTFAPAAFASYTLTVTGGVTVNSNGAFTVTNVAGGVAAHTVTIGGNLVADGTFNMVSAVDDYATVVFNGGSQQTISGSGTTTFFSLTDSNTSTNGLVLNRNITLTPNTTTTTTLTVTAGDVLDLGAYTANRSVAGAGTLTVNGKLKIGGTNALPTNYTTYTLGAASTIEYNGTNQTVTDRAYAGNLTFSGSGTKSWTLGAARVVTGILTVDSGATLTTAGNFTLGITGATNVTGTINLGGTSTKTFTGDVTLNSGAVWNETGVSAYSIAGNFINNATTFTANTGLHTFSGAAKALSGTTATAVPSATFSTSHTNNGILTCATILNITGGAVVLTNNGTINVATALSNTGGVTQGATGTLNIGGTSGITTLTATAVGNTVNYTGATGQTVKAVSYHNLGFSGAGIKTTPATLSIAGNWNVDTIADLLTNNSNVTVGGDITNTGNGMIDSGSGTITLAGNWTNEGAFNSGNGTVVYNGGSPQTVASLNYNNLTLSNAGAKNAVDTLNVGGNLTNSATLDMAGNNLLVSGTNTNSGTIRFSGASNGLAINSGTIEYYGASQTITPGTYNNLTINQSGGDATIDSLTTVGGILTLTAGNVVTGDSELYIDSTGSVSGGSTGSHIVGNLRKYIPTGGPTINFEIGDATTYAPTSITFNNVTGASDLTISTTTGDHSQIANSIVNSDKSANRYWTTTDYGISFDNYSATLNFVAGDLDGPANTANFIVGKYDGDWSYPALGLRTGTSTQATGLTSFSDFQLGEINPAKSVLGSISQKTDGSGQIDIQVNMSSPASEDTRLMVEYSDNGGDNWYNPYLIAVDTDNGSTDLNNANTYQVGDDGDAIDTSGGEVNVSIVWDTKSSSNGNGSLDNVENSNIQIRVTPNNWVEDGTVTTSSNISLDNLAPEGLGSFTVGNTTPFHLSWDTASDTNFDRYEIWYGDDQSDVQNRTGSASSTFITSASTDSAVIEGLTANETTYYFQIWAIDVYGNEEDVSDISVTTPSAPAISEGGADLSSITPNDVDPGLNINVEGTGYSTTETIGDQIINVIESVQILNSGNDVELSTPRLPTVTIPDGAVVYSDGSWDGVIHAPQAIEGTQRPSGFRFGKQIFNVGSLDTSLLFDKPLEIVFSEASGETVAYKPAGSTQWFKITNECGGTYDNPSLPDFPGECYINHPSNGNKKVLTYHLTTFASLIAVYPTYSPQPEEVEDQLEPEPVSDEEKTIDEEETGAEDNIDQQPKVEGGGITGLLGEYTVKSGDNLSSIAAKLYGNSGKWERLVELNKDKYPSLHNGGVNIIYSGWVLKYDFSIENIVFIPPVAAAPVLEAGEYIVKSGDNLSNIAMELYGDSKKWYDLVTLNAKKYPTLWDSPGLIGVGWRLKY